METNCSKGDSIILTDSCSQTFMGVVKSININLGRIVLSSIYQLPENKAIAGYRHFDKDEIVKIEKIEPDKPVIDSPCSKELIKVDEPPSELQEPKPEPKSNKISKKVETKWVFIKDFGPDFDSAISQFKSSSRVGVTGRDTSKGRFVRASVLAMSNSSSVFVFDLQALGDEVLEKGLKEVLESHEIVKVVHDCRLLSDCLKHKHLIHLENVRDVEAEDVMVVFQDRRMIRRHSRSLEYLARVYLGIELEVCNDRGEIWNERPLPENLLESLVSCASVLLPLQEAIERKYLQKLIDASSVYNTHLRSLDFFDVLNEEPKKTLRKQMIKLVVPKRQIRSSCKTKET